VVRRTLSLNKTTYNYNASVIRIISARVVELPCRWSLRIWSQNGEQKNSSLPDAAIFRAFWPPPISHMELVRLWNPGYSAVSYFPGLITAPTSTRLREIILVLPRIPAAIGHERRGLNYLSQPTLSHEGFATWIIMLSYCTDKLAGDQEYPSDDADLVTVRGLWSRCCTLGALIPSCR